MPTTYRNAERYSAHEPGMDQFIEKVQSQHLEPGSLIMGRYEVQRKLGTGGMASVYVVVDRYRTNTLIALKILHKDFINDKTHLARFIREVQLLNRITHPNVVRTFDIGNDGQMVFFTMEYVMGESLEKILDRRTLTSAEIAKLLLGICDGLSAVHAQGIFHRDIKPANFIVAPDNLIKIIDFGVAREKVSNLTGKLQVVGSMCYVAPELWVGKRLTPAADLYSLGVVLYEMATGLVPFEHEHPAEVMRMHLEDAVVPPKRFKPECPDWLNHLCLWLLKKKPKDRPQSAEEIIEYVIAKAPGELSTKTEFDATAPMLPLTAPEPEPLAVNRVRSRPSVIAKRRSRTYIFRVTATSLYNNVAADSLLRPPKKITLTVPLPRRAAVVLEIEAPSKDFLFFGLFLASLQGADWYLTRQGLMRYTSAAEGNPLLRVLIEQFGMESGLAIAKATAILFVLLLTIMARRTKWIKNTITVLCWVYLLAAILPWLYILSHPV